MAERTEAEMLEAIKRLTRRMHQYNVWEERESRLAYVRLYSNTEISLLPDERPYCIKIERLFM